LALSAKKRDFFGPRGVLGKKWFQGIKAGGIGPGFGGPTFHLENFPNLGGRSQNPPPPKKFQAKGTMIGKV